MRTHVVIGASSGIGAAIAGRIARPGQRLLLADIDVDALEKAACSLEGDIEIARCDITNHSDVQLLAERAGTLGSLILTAGLSPTMGTGRRVLEVDLVGAARVVETFLPIAINDTVAVLVSSMAGHIAPNSPEVDAILAKPLAIDLVESLAAAGIDVDNPAITYMYAKRGVVRLAQAAAAAWALRDARIVSVSPGIVDTPMGQRELQAQPVMADMIAQSALRRAIHPDEIASVVEFLVSPGGRAITGADILVDAGIVARMVSYR